MQSLGVENVQGGNDLLSQIRGRMSQGLDPQMMELIQRQGLGNINGMMSAGRQQLNQLAGENLPASARFGALSNMYGQGARATAGLNDSILMQDLNARNQNFQGGVGNWLNLAQTGAGIGNMTNQLNLARTGMQNQNALKMYEVDKAGEFNWGQAIGGLFQGAGAVGGAMTGRPNKQ